MASTISVCVAEPELSGGRGRFIPFLPNFARSEDRKLFEQAEVNFITAQLRKESGAAISPEEFKDAKRVYIPLTSDDESILAQKALARQIAIQGMINESLGAFEQLQSSLPGDTFLTPSGQSGTTSSGLQFIIE